jgi:2-polyprenyl-3-methyl-5-hydroxy-6-metoxy-1,4-benzoquinol methylase
LEVDERRPNSHTMALDFTGHGRRVLELGCAAGHVTTALKARGHTVVGVEIDPVSAATARTIADEVITADLDREPLTSLITDRRFDVVLMGDVLEHLRDPLTVLTEAVTLLEPDGIAVVSIPNVAYVDLRLALLEGEWNYQSDGLLDDTHLRFFTRRSLFRFAADAGLTVTELRRVVKAPGTSNVAPRTTAIGTDLRDLVLLDPNATTYVFVARLERRTPETEAVCRSLDEALSKDEDAAAAMIVDIIEARRREYHSLLDSRRELIALQNSKLMRWSQLPRRIYRRLRRLLRLG